MERLNIVKYPEYVIIQILRMDFTGGKTVKNPTAIDISRPDNIFIDKRQYSIIGTISHMGTPDAGHNRAYLRKGSYWFLCEDSKLPACQIPSDTPFEQSYCILLKRCNLDKQDEIPQMKECSVVIEPLSGVQAQNTYAGAARASKQGPERFLSPRASHPITPVNEKQKANLKRSYSFEEHQASSSEQSDGEKALSSCQGCGKRFARLYAHLTKNGVCQKLYDIVM